LTVLGCGRSAVVVTPERSAPAVEAAVSTRQEADGAHDIEFRFPDDAEGTLLAKILPPGETEEQDENRAEPLCRFSPPDEPPIPVLPLPPTEAALPERPAETTTVAFSPRMVMEEPLADFADAAPLPPAPPMPVGGRIRVHSVDVNQPIPLPLRNQPVPDRASLEDPTADYSTAAALAARMPAHKGKAPFQKLTLPDPYDHRRPTRILIPPESDQPVTATPRTPDR
jgi:hypothetical protein